jgi:hypothetical protein
MKVDLVAVPQGDLAQEGEREVRAAQAVVPRPAQEGDHAAKER